MTRYLPAALGAALCVTAVQAGAQDGDSRLSTEFVIELQNDFTYDSTNSLNELNNTHATFEGALSFALTERTSVNAGFTFEQITGPTGDSFFEDHGVYLSDLFLAHDFGTAEVVLGKFSPAFGMAWDAAPGIYGADFAEDYELSEMLGGAVNIPFAAAGGEHVLSFALFQADRTILSNSLGEERGQTARFMGGPTNTSGTESVAVALSGEMGRTGYDLGVQRLAKGLGDAKDQTGYVAGIVQQVGYGETPAELMAEMAYFEGFGGTTSSAFYLTAGVAVPVGPVTLSGSVSRRAIDTLPTDRLATVTAEMELAEGLTGAIGYRWGDEGGDKNQTIGTLLVFEF